MSIGDLSVDSVEAAQGQAKFISQNGKLLFIHFFQVRTICIGQALAAQQCRNVIFLLRYGLV
ncbi:hypothetical protein ACEN2T_17470 [Pseudomonas sp. W22_MBD1_FP4]|uniref:hypothetical protein n=1 Tax=Pseudomonas sp. W22_MBD1_FP4 TaxID=3240272 RepID=UPI003F960B2B